MRIIVRPQTTWGYMFSEKRHKIFALAAGSVAVICGIAAFILIATSPSKEAAQCQQQILRRLDTPASFQVIAINQTSTPYPVDDYVAAMLERNKIELYEIVREGNAKNNYWALKKRTEAETEMWSLWKDSEYKSRIEKTGGPFLRVVAITFDAQNIYGATIRRYWTCRFYAQTRNGTLEPEGLAAQQYHDDHVGPDIGNDAL